MSSQEALPGHGQAGQPKDVPQPDEQLVPSLIQRLKNKKVVQWALGYLAGAFVVLQLMDALEGALNLSRYAQQGIVALLACGLTITVIVAWFHGAKGQQRVRPAEILTVSVTLFLGISASALLWTGPAASAPPGTPAKSTSGSFLLPSLEAEETATASEGDSSSIGRERASVAAPDTISNGGNGEDHSVSKLASKAPDEARSEGRPGEVDPMLPPALLPENPSLFVGDSVHLELSTDQFAYWTSSDGSVARVMSDGLVWATGPGSALITAILDDVEVSTRLNVLAVRATEVVIAPVGPIRPGESARPEVTVKLSNGQTRGRAGLQWSSSDTSVVAIGSRGTLNGAGLGSATIFAERDGVVGSIRLTVEAGSEGQVPTQSAGSEALFPTLERYRAALQGQDMAGVTATYPSMSQEERVGWETLFSLGGLIVEFSDLGVLVSSSTHAEVEFQQTLYGDRIERNVTLFVASLVLVEAGWRIQKLRAVGS